MKVQLDLKTIIILILFILLMLGLTYHINTSRKHALQHSQDEKLQRALTDTLHIYKDKNGKLTYEKLTLQADVSDLRDKNITLTAAQKDLLKAVDKLNKDNKVITAALIEMGVKLDGIVNDKPVEVGDNHVRFATASDSLTYDIMVTNVRAIGNPTLRFTKFDLPNTQIVSFQWKDNRKEGYPISFSVSNSNPLYKVYDINSYAIPELEKSKVDPNFWQKLGKFSRTTGGKIVFLGIGFAAGVALSQ